MKLLENPHEGEWCAGIETGCVTPPGMVWDAAVAATLEDVARDLEALAGEMSEASLEYRRGGLEEVFMAAEHDAISLRNLAGRYRAAMKEAK